MMELFGGWRFYYNKAVHYIRNPQYYEDVRLKHKDIMNENYQKKNPDKEIKKSSRKIKINPSTSLPLVRRILNEDSKEWEQSMNYRTKDMAIQQALSHYKTCTELRKNGNIRTFDISYKKKKGGSQMCKLDYRTLKIKNDKHICMIPSLKNIDNTVKIDNKKDKDFLCKNIDNITSDYTICRNKKYKYYLIVQVKVATKIRKPSYDTVALDPGIRTFNAFYSPDGLTGEFGKGVSNKLFSIQKRLDWLTHILDTKELNHHKRVRIRRRCVVLRAKIQHIVLDLHKKTIRFLVSKFNTILLPKFEVSKMVEKIPERFRKINNKSTRSLLALSHYQFRTRLLDKAKRTGRNVILVNEAYTSKTCTLCGKLNDIGGNKTYSCSCGNVMDRDLQGARNIYIRYLTKMR